MSQNNYQDVKHDVQFAKEGVAKRDTCTYEMSMKVAWHGLRARFYILLSKWFEVFKSWQNCQEDPLVDVQFAKERVSKIGVQHQA